MKIKLNVVCIILFIFVLFLSGCGVNPYADKYPDMSDGEVWICNEPEIFFHWVESSVVPRRGSCKINGESEAICLLFEGPYVEFYTIPETDNYDQMKRLLSGYCTFEENIFSINDLGKDDLFNYQYETLTFHRYAKDEVEWADGWPVPKEGRSRYTNSEHL